MPPCATWKAAEKRGRLATKKDSNAICDEYGCGFIKKKLHEFRSVINYNWEHDFENHGYGTAHENAVATEKKLHSK